MRYVLTRQDRFIEDSPVEEWTFSDYKSAASEFDRLFAANVTDEDEDGWTMGKKIVLWREFDTLEEAQSGGSYRLIEKDGGKRVLRSVSAAC